MKKSTREASAWANCTVWTERMLDALTVGVRGGKWHALIDKVCSELNLFASARKAIGKQGAAGADRQNTIDFGEHTIAEIKKLREQFQSRTYRPKAVRRVQIPKPGSDQKRPLGIPRSATIPHHLCPIPCRSPLTGKPPVQLGGRGTEINRTSLPRSLESLRRPSESLRVRTFGRCRFYGN